MEYSWDSEQSEDVRVHTFVNAVRVCDSHTGLTPDQAYEKVKVENPRKNLVLQEIIDNIPTLSEVDDKGNRIPDLSKITWFYDANRQLVVNLKNTRKEEKDNIKVVLGTKFGKNVNIL